MNNVTTGILGAAIGLLASFEIGPELSGVLTAAINAGAATVLAIAVRYIARIRDRQRMPRRRSKPRAKIDKNTDHNI